MELGQIFTLIGVVATATVSVATAIQTYFAKQVLYEVKHDVNSNFTRQAEEIRALRSALVEAERHNAFLRFPGTSSASLPQSVTIPSSVDPLLR